MVRVVAVLTALATIAIGQTQRWVYRCNGTGNGDDAASSLVVGPDGNIYAVGYTTGSGTGADFTVISLTPADSERWVYRYNGPGNGDDYAAALVFGPDSNLYAAGYSTGSGTGTDFTVVSLTPGGTERWVYRYNGPGNDDDDASSLVVGPDRNIYATGYSTGNGTSYDFTVISLTPADSERWVYRYDSPASGTDWGEAIVFGADGNIYAGGNREGSGGYQNIAVISLTPGGSERWVYGYDGPGAGGDRGSSLMYGGDGNIYVAGNTTGNGTSYDFTVISLTPADSERWVYRYNGPGNEMDQARTKSLAWGADGNIYAAGFSGGDGTFWDMVVISLTPGDSERWVYRYDGPGHSYDMGGPAVCGADGNVYTAGYSTGLGTGYDFTVIGLTPGDSERWVYRYDGPMLDYDVADDLVFGPDGNIYAAGVSTGIGTGADFTVVSLNPSSGVAEAGPALTRDAPGLLSARVQGRVLAYRLKLAEPARVSMSLYDLQGRRVVGWQVHAPAGASHYTQGLSALSSGVYFLTAGVSGQSQSERRKVLVWR